MASCQARAEFDFLGYLEGALRPSSSPNFQQILVRFDADFPAEDLATRYERVKAWSEEAPEPFQTLLGHVYGCYYQDAGVQEAIGVGAGPPFPRGNTVEEGDLSLLDPVMRNPVGVAAGLRTRRPEATRLRTPRRTASG